MIKYFDDLLAQKMLDLGYAGSKRAMDCIFYDLTVDLVKPNLFIEAGAFEGTASLNIKSALPNCEIWAFEANPDNYQHFLPRFKDSGVNYVNMAVSDTGGSITFFKVKEF